VLTTFSLSLSAAQPLVIEAAALAGNAPGEYRYTLHLLGMPVQFALDAAVAQPVDADGAPFNESAGELELTSVKRSKSALKLSARE
jgi:hypothetical protein